MSNKIPKVVLWTAENLNDYAEFAEQDKDVPGHSPGSALYWFNGLARETLPWWQAAKGQALLSPIALRLLAQLLESEKGEPQ